ncbi:MAG: thioredoxin domain-containing protein, partial [Bdellovibrionota bacterium]
EASMCVSEQSVDKFWKFHDKAFKQQDKLSTADIESLVTASGADLAKFKECLGTKKFADFIQQDMMYGEKIGVKSTPTFFVNGQLISGARSLEEFSEIIDEEMSAQ